MSGKQEDEQKVNRRSGKMKRYYAHPTAIIESEDIGEDCRIWHFVHIREGASLGKNCNIGKGVYIDRDVRIGNNVKIQNFVSVYKGVEIEDDVFVGPAVTFTNDLLPRAFRWEDELIEKTFVRKGASIGANSTILCGIEIGRYAMIGAGSVVTRNVPEFGLVFGNPAELRGFVCYCGRKLTDDPKAEGEFECEYCGKTVVIEG